MCPEELPQTDGDSDELARADGKEDDAEPGLRGAATRNPPSPFDSADGTAEWLLIAEKVGRRFLRRVRNLHTELRWLHDLVYDDWLQEARLKLFKVVAARW